MDLEKYTQKSQEALLAAQHLAQDYQHQVFEPIHLLLVLIQQQDGIVRATITKVSGGTQAIQEELGNELVKRPKINGAPIGGLKVVAESGWFAARPSGTKNIYKINDGGIISESS